MSSPSPKASDYSMPDEILTNVTKSDALQHAEITALRQMGDAVQSIGRSVEALASRIDNLGGKVDDVRERVIRLEAEKTSKVIERMETDFRSALGKSEALLQAALCRIDTLESSRDQARGAQSVWEWLSKNAAWLFAGTAAFVAGLALKSGLFK